MRIEFLASIKYNYHTLLTLEDNVEADQADEGKDQQVNSQVDPKQIGASGSG